MKTVTRAFPMVLISLCLTGLAMSAESPAQLLEKGIYQEETEGNLDAAIKIYRQIVTDAKETEVLAAEAQFRLGQCLLKQGKESEAVAAFQSLIEDFPNQKEVVAKAKKHLPDQIELLPAPWTDGERLTLTMKLAGGQKIGLVGLAVEAAEVDGKPVWKMLARRYIVGGQNQGVSRVVVDQATNRPMSTAWDHTLLGIANSVFTADKLTVTTQATPSKEAKTTSVEISSPVFSNDQVFYVFRQLPLKVGYKTTIPIRVAFTGGNQFDLEVNVPEKETVETPLGNYDCFRVETNIMQTFWIADVPQRYLVKFDAQAVTAELTSIGDGKPTTYEDSAVGFSFTVPGDCFLLDVQDEKRESRAHVRAVSPELACYGVAVKEVEKKDVPDADKKSPREWAESKIKELKDFFGTVELRGEGISEVPFVGTAAVNFVADVATGGRDFVVQNTLAIREQKEVDVSLRAGKESYDSTVKVFEAIRASFTLP